MNDITDEEAQLALQRSQSTRAHEYYVVYRRDGELLWSSYRLAGAAVQFANSVGGRAFHIRAIFEEVHGER